MAEYDLGFAAKMAETADLLDQRDGNNYDARRVMVYLSRVSMEIAMKALLERAGMPVSQIRDRGHRLNDLLTDLDGCEVLVQIEDKKPAWTTVSVVRDLVIDMGLVRIPIGDYIASTHPDLSVYPNQIRYGSTVVDFEPTFLVRSAVLLAIWAQQHAETIRIRADRQ